MGHHRLLIYPYIYLSLIYPYLFIPIPPSTSISANNCKFLLLCGAFTKTKCLLLPFLIIFITGSVVVTVGSVKFCFVRFVYESEDSFPGIVHFFSIISFVLCCIVIIFIFVLPSFLVVDTILKFRTELKHKHQNIEHLCEQPTPRINQQNTAMIDEEGNATTALLATQPQCQSLSSQEPFTLVTEDEASARHAPYASEGAVEPLLRHAPSAATSEAEPQSIHEPSTPEHNGAA